MDLDTQSLEIYIRHQAERLLDLIENAESLLHANQNGALAEGFVVDLVTLMASYAQTLEQLDLLFSKVTDLQLIQLS